MSEKVVIQGDARETKSIKLPSSGVTVEVYPSLLLSELEGVDIEKAQAGNVQHIIKMLTPMIKSWNAYAPDTKEPLPVNEENVGQVLHAGDIEKLTESVLAFQKSEKKN